MRPTLLLQLIFREGSMRFGSEVICDPHQLGANGYILAALSQRQDPNDEALHSLAIHGAPPPQRRPGHDTKMLRDKNTYVWILFLCGSGLLSLSERLEARAIPALRVRRRGDRVGDGPVSY